MQKTRISCAILAALASSPLYAQESQSKAQFETIEVTATKRTESIQDVPVAVSALSGDALENMGIDNFQDYVEFLPNVVFQGTGPGQNEIYIRGAATTQSSITLSSVQALQPSVAFYQDEMPVSMAGRNLDIFATDVERVEVLAGLRAGAHRPAVSRLGILQRPAPVEEVELPYKQRPLLIRVLEVAARVQVDLDADIELDRHAQRRVRVTAYAGIRAGVGPQLRHEFRSQRGQAALEAVAHDRQPGLGVDVHVDVSRDGDGAVGDGCVEVFQHAGGEHVAGHYAGSQLGGVELLQDLGGKHVQGNGSRFHLLGEEGEPRLLGGIRGESVGSGQYALVGLEVGKGLTVALRKMNPQKDHGVVEEEVFRDGRHAWRGVVTEKYGIVSAVDFGCDGGPAGGVAPKDGAVVVDQLEAEMPGSVVVFSLDGDLARVGHGSGGQGRAAACHRPRGEGESPHATSKGKHRSKWILRSIVLLY